MPRVFNKEFLANITPVETEAIESNEASESSAEKTEPKTTLREAHNKLKMSDLMGQELGQQAKDKAAKAEEAQAFDSNEAAIGSVYMLIQGLRGIVQMLSGMKNGRNQQR